MGDFLSKLFIDPAAYELPGARRTRHAHVRVVPALEAVRASARHAAQSSTRRGAPPSHARAARPPSPASVAHPLRRARARRADDLVATFHYNGSAFNQTISSDICDVEGQSSPRLRIACSFFFVQVCLYSSVSKPVSGRLSTYRFRPPVRRRLWRGTVATAHGGLRLHAFLGRCPHRRRQRTAAAGASPGISMPALACVRACVRAPRRAAPAPAPAAHFRAGTGW